MADERLDLSAWQQDGHVLNLRLGTFTSPVGPRELGNSKTYGQLLFEVECPEGSACRRWLDEHTTSRISRPPHHCFVKGDLEGLGPYDFIEEMATHGLPEGFSLDFPVVLDWRDRGEDGIEWRPAPVQPRSAFAKLARFLETAEAPVSVGLAKKDDGKGALTAIEWGKEAEDSPMVGAALYGTGETVLESLADALKDKK